MTRAKDISRLITDANFAGTLTVGDLTASSLNGGQFGGRRNIIINGAMQVAQRGTSVADIGASGGYFTTDRWAISVGETSAGRLTSAQVGDGPDGIANCTKLTCTTADTTIAAGELLQFQTKLEGQDLQQMNKGIASAKEVTVSFYVKGNAAATYSVEMHDRDNTRFNSQEFSVTTDWVRIVKTFAADADDGSSPYGDDNAVSMSLNFNLHGGSTYTGGSHTDNVWHEVVNQRLGDNATSFFDSTDRTFFITGVQMEVGSVATPFEHRSFGEELQLCQRYLFKDQDGSGAAYKRYAHGGASATTVASCSFTIPTPLRAVPTLVLSGDVNTFLAFSAGATDALTGLIIATDDDAGTFNRAVELTATVGSGLVAGEQVSIISNNSTSTFISLDAEL
jgi:hypothetical protein